MTPNSSYVQSGPLASHGLRNDALISENLEYRYWLSRGWGVPGSRYVNFVCLNPSTADGLVDDPTVRRMTRFAKDWGYDGLYVTNLYALRRTEPSELWISAVDPIGPVNDYWIEAVARGAALVVCAWGAHGDRKDRGKSVAWRLRHVNAHLFCLGLTKAGQPRHPLYLPATASVEQWR